jgi:hypothetical protein
MFVLQVGASADANDRALKPSDRCVHALAGMKIKAITEAKKQARPSRLGIQRFHA